jgi:PAS domain S-box-containing protein
MNATDNTIRVLLVDDDPEFVETIAAVLEREDSRFDVRTATDADSGLEILETDRIDCVVSDYGMPGMDGIEFLDRVRESHGELPFVLLTGEGDEIVASDAISAGVTDYVPKGRREGQYSLLASRLADAVEKRRARRSLKRRKRELERLNDRFQSFVRHSPDVITIVEPNGRIRYNSPAIEHVLGYEQDELVGDMAYEYVHPDDREDVRASFEALVETEGTAREKFECRFRHADGSWVWIDSVASDRTGADGEGFLINSRDVSERKVRERELEAKTERLDEFASIVSHDLQTPITVADARLDLAMDECDSEHLPAIGDALERMDEIVDATLTLAREGQVVDETEPVELAAAAERWADPLGSDVTLRIEADRLTVEADRERLRRVIENLFSNAVEHGSTGNRPQADDVVEHGSTGSRLQADDAVEHCGEGVTVVVGELEGADGFYVADDGPGIPEDIGEKIFEPGQSLSPDGTGFGLAIVEEIVEAHGWEVEATESEFGGARFEISGVDMAM